MTGTDAFLNAYCGMHGVDPARFGCAQPREGESGTVENVDAVAAVAVDHLVARAKKAIREGDWFGRIIAQPPLESWHIDWQLTPAGIVRLDITHQGLLTPGAKDFAIRHLAQLGCPAEKGITTRSPLTGRPRYILVAWLTVRRKKVQA